MQGLKTRTTKLRRTKIPPPGTFFVVLSNASLNVASFLIALPTSKEYVSSFNVDVTQAGLLVGLAPLVNALLQPILIPIFQKWKLRNIFMISCLLAITGNTIYSLADYINEYILILVGRSILGIAGGPVYSTTYTARASDTSNRSTYMECVSISLSSGYVLGPLMRLATQVVSQASSWEGAILNQNTAPRWRMSILFVVNFILIAALFEKPSKPTDCGEQHNEAQPKLETASSDDNEDTPTSNNLTREKAAVLALVFAFTFITMMNTAAFEFAAIFNASEQWGWSIASAAGYLSGFNFAVIIFAFVGVERWLTSDRLGILVCFVGMMASCIFFFEFPVHVPGSAVLFGVGALLVLFATQTAKGFLFGLVSKLPPAEYHQTVMSLVALFYPLGRFMGSLVAPYLLETQQAFGSFLLATNVVSVISLIAVYPMLAAPDETSAAKVPSAN